MEQFKELSDKLQLLEIKQTEVAGDVSHIKTRLDNGISGTLTKIFLRLDEIIPKVKDNTYWVGKFKQAVCWIAGVGVAGGAISLSFYLIRTMYTK